MILSKAFLPLKDTWVSDASSHDGPVHVDYETRWHGGDAVCGILVSSQQVPTNMSYGRFLPKMAFELAVILAHMMEV